MTHIFVLHRTEIPLITKVSTLVLKYSTKKNIVGTSIMDTIGVSLVHRDTNIFHDLINDTFDSFQYINIHNESMKIRTFLESEGEHSEYFIDKLVQLMQALDQRTGCIILGEVCTGKSLLWNELERVMKKCGMPVQSHPLNVKALQYGDFLGMLNDDTGEWKDGVLTSLVRKALQKAENERTWLVCDGEIDPEWIESLNSVLDDNRLLTLPTGERLNLSPNIKFIFETRDLHFVSPATISRNAVICLSKWSKEHPIFECTELEELKKLVNNAENFILLGKDGSGRDTILRDLFAPQVDVEMKILDCFGNTNPTDLIQVFEECCLLSSNLEGKAYHSSGGKRIVLVLKNTEKLKCDKYGHYAFFSFLHHLLDYGGFYDSYSTFVEVRRIQIVIVSNSIDWFMKNSSSTVQRLRKNMAVGLIDSPSKDTLIDQTSNHLMKNATALNINMEQEECLLHVRTLIALLKEAVEVAYPKSSIHVPVHILHHFVQNITKYEKLESESMRKKIVAFETLRSAENLLSMHSHNGLRSVRKSTVEDYNLLGALDCFFVPKSSCTFSLVTRDEFIHHLESYRSFDQVLTCEEVLQTFSTIQHALFCGSKNITLSGRQGSGRKTLLKLACEINCITYMCPKPTDDWSTLKLKDQLQQILFKAGVEEERICFHVEEFVLSQPEMITLMCRVTSVTESTLTYFFDEKELQHCVHSFQGVVTSREDLLRTKRTLVSNICNNLSICFSKTIMYDFSKKLMKDTSIVHVRELTQQSIQKVIQSKCSKIFPQVEQCDFDVCNVIMQMHLSTVEEFGSSQNDLFGWIDIWMRLFESHHKKNAVHQETLKLGLQKLYDAKDSVNNLREESEQVKAEVTKAQTEADKAMSEITTEMTSSKLKMAEIDKLRLIITEKCEECKANKDEIEMELAKIRPMLQASEQGK